MKSADSRTIGTPFRPALWRRPVCRPAAVARPVGVPFDDPSRLPDMRTPDRLIGFGHLTAGAVRGHGAHGDTEVVGDVGSDPPRRLGIGLCHGPKPSCTN